MASLLRCELALGPEPWERLADGPVRGVVTWGESDVLDGLIRIRGAHSRRFPKKSLQLDFPDRRLPDSPPDGHTVKRIHLNADYIDPTLMRTALCFTLFDRMGVPAPSWRHVQVTVSGEQAGTYVALESVDGDFCRRRGWPQGSLFYAINRNANFGLVSPFSRELKQPLEAGYKPLFRADPAPIRSMLTDLNLASERAFPRTAERWIDLDLYFRWLMVAVFVGNRDGFVHNYALYQHPEDGRFRLIPWDYDATWGVDVNGRPARLDRVPVGGWNKLSWRLLQNPRYRGAYRDRFLEALAGPLSPEQTLPEIDKLCARLEPWIDSTRHESEATPAYQVEVDRLRWWATERASLLQKQLADL